MAKDELPKRGEENRPTLDYLPGQLEALRAQSRGSTSAIHPRSGDPRILALLGALDIQPRVSSNVVGTSTRGRVELILLPPMVSDALPVADTRCTTIGDDIQPVVLSNGTNTASATSGESQDVSRNINLPQLGTLKFFLDDNDNAVVSEQFQQALNCFNLIIGLVSYIKIPTLRSVRDDINVLPRWIDEVCNTAPECMNLTIEDSADSGILHVKLNGESPNDYWSLELDKGKRTIKIRWNIDLSYLKGIADAPLKED